MFGRAGRGGAEAGAKLMYTAKELQTEVNTELVHFVSNKENCRWRSLLQNLGSNESLVGGHTLCCDVCFIGVVPYSRLKLLMKRPLVGCVRKRKV